MGLTELEEAVSLANRILDTPAHDPDSMESVLSRQFLRAQERVASLESDLAEAKKLAWKHENDTRHALEVRDTEIGNLYRDLVEAKRGSETGPCGRHPRMFWQVTQPPKAYQTPPVYGCTLCSDLTAAYERGLRDAAEEAWSVYDFHEGHYCADESHIKEAILALKDRGAKGGSE